MDSPAPRDVIARKRDGHALSREQIEAFVRGATDGSWADYQLSALLMAIFLRGMTEEETAALTEAVVHSGDIADLSSIRRPKIDKHSTGGVGDKVSLHLAPIVASCGVAVPMVSGRGLGHTGGTLDKLESIPGFRTDLPLDRFRDQVDRVGTAIVGQTAELAPADKKLYALRDVTATVGSVPLICASVLGKKLAEGIDGVVLDVKFGRGAFMEDLASARQLAKALVAIGKRLRTPARALLTSMDQPLGRAVGNAVEVAESIACLKGKGPPDLMAVTWALGEQMLILARIAATAPEAHLLLQEAVASGRALETFRAMVEAQEGDSRVADDPARLPQAALRAPLVSPVSGWVQSVDARAVAQAVLRLGAGRNRADDRIDPTVGVSELLKVGEPVEAGQNLCVLHAAGEHTLEEARWLITGAIRVAEAPVAAPSLIADLIAD